MTWNYHKVNQVVSSTAAAVSDVISLFELIDTSPGTWYVAVDLASAIFSIPVNKDHHKQLASGWQGWQ